MFTRLMKLRQQANAQLSIANRVVTLTNNLELLRELLRKDEHTEETLLGCGFEDHSISSRVACKEYMGVTKLSVNREEFTLCLELLYDTYLSELNTLTKED